MPALQKKRMAPRVGFEPTTNRLTAVWKRHFLKPVEITLKAISPGLSGH